MSHPSNRKGAADPASSTDATDFNAKVRDLCRRVDERTNAKSRHKTIVAVVGAVLCAGLVAGLTHVTSLVQRMDTDAVAQIGRIELQSALPGTRKALQTHLDQEAPRLVGQALNGVIDTLPSLRAYLVQGLSAKQDEVLAKFEGHVLAQMEHGIRNTKAAVDAADSDASDLDKLDKLLDVVTEDFESNFSVAVDALYPDYQAGMSDVKSYLDHLKNGDPASLSSEERIKREIIETLLRMMALERERESESEKQGETQG